MTQHNCRIFTPLIIVASQRLQFYSFHFKVINVANNDHYLIALCFVQTF